MKVIKNNLLLRLSRSSGLMDCLSGCSFKWMGTAELWLCRLCSPPLMFTVYSDDCQTIPLSSDISALNAKRRFSRKEQTEIKFTSFFEGKHNRANDESSLMVVSRFIFSTTKVAVGTGTSPNLHSIYRWGIRARESGSFPFVIEIILTQFATREKRNFCLFTFLARHFPITTANL